MPHCKSTVATYIVILAFILCIASGVVLHLVIAKLYVTVLTSIVIQYVAKQFCILRQDAIFHHVCVTERTQ